MKYYIAENGQQAGPFEPNELLAHGLTVNSLVWCEGMPNWISASQVPELMALLSGQTFNPGNIDVQLPKMPELPQTPPVGQPSTLPQVPPFGGQTTQPTTTGTPYGQGTTNQPYAGPQYAPSGNPTNQVMPKTWFTESVLVTALSLLCCFNVVGLVTGVLAIMKSRGVKSKFTAGDVAGANSDSASARKWVLITLAVGVIWSLIQGFRYAQDPSLLPQIQQGAIGTLYGF